MSIGWVLLTTKGLNFAKSFGGCDGRGSSLGAAAVGMLSFLTFVTLMAKHRSPTNIKIKYVADTLKPFNRSKEHSNYNTLYPNTTLSTKYDIIE